MPASGQKLAEHRPNAAIVIPDILTRAAWRLIDRALGVDPNSALNDAPARPPSPDLGREMHLTAKELKSRMFDADGERLDYRRARDSHVYGKLRDLSVSLAACSLEDLGQGPELTAFWINLYNALVIDAIIQFDISGRVGPRLFRRAAYQMDGLRFCLDDIEHGVLRGNRPHPLFRIRPFGSLDRRRTASLAELDPRLHFALVCGARSCPPIRVYQGSDLDNQLDKAASSFINGAWVEVDTVRPALLISRIFKWYEGDFEKSGGVRATIARYAADERVKNAALDESFSIAFQTYDWSVNSLV